ncbi:hypothetical protein [Vibrio renipiscarius]|uniref:Cytoplasmic protein n=1 Tax=Vibrio renipiscarius TaxID=1461322 RepID=A0A0C2NGC0_9VIBR|nr:hypothetical protein [Vibrio renipiscarius]KII75410.1 hypothetical protein OJ16_19215 [Vibrio renipiscarius]KII78863.1 hypothetical protein PL18_11325 [Vibrio renipiscarius]
MLRDLNVCKSGHCSNLGEPGAPDYEYHIRPLGFLAMRCDKCAATPPMLDNESYLKIWHSWQQKVALYSGRCCPDCGSRHFKCFGRSAVQKPRRQCKACGRTFSVRDPVTQAQRNNVEHIMRLMKKAKPDDGDNILMYAAEKGVHFDRATAQIQRLSLQMLWQCPPAQRIASVSFIVPYRGENNALWCLISTNMDTGEVIHISTTLVELELSAEGRYQSCQDAPSTNWDHTTSAMRMAEDQEARFLARGQFDRCDFGLVKVAKKGTSHALPVLTAHAHFALLRYLGHGIGQDGEVGSHCLQHEVFLRGACITQYAHCVKRDNMALLYVVGETKSQCTHHSTRKLGWWQNLWHSVTDTQGNQKAYSVLCGNNRLDAEQISLSTCFAAIRYIEDQIACHHLGEFTPTRVNHLMALIAQNFNQDLRFED